MKNALMYRLNMLFAYATIAMLRSHYIPDFVLRFTLHLQIDMNKFLKYDWIKA